MKQITFSLLLYFLFLSFHQSAIAQTDTLQLKIKARSFGDSIAVRWAPLDRQSWIMGNKIGYELTKISTAPDGGSKTELFDLFKPLNEDLFRQSKDDEFATIAAELLYHPGSIVNNQDVISTENKVKEEESRFGFSLLIADISLETAKKMGLAYVDKNVKEGFEYQYIITLAEDSSDKIVYKDQLKIRPEFQPPLPMPDSLTAEWKDQKVVLKWLSKELSTDYSAYIIEKSKDDGQSFQRVNPTPYVPVTPSHLEEAERFSYYSDSLAENQKEYAFRVRGISPFGEMGPPSEIVWGSGIPSPIQAQVIIQGITELAEKQFNIEWFVGPQWLDKIKGFNVYVSRFNKENFQLLNSELLSKEASSFIDPNPARVNFYKVEIVDENDYPIISGAALGQLLDQEPPAVPVGLAGNCDSTGLITLNWQANEEEDLSGYYVYYSNGKEGEYTILTREGECKETTYQDSVRHLNPTEERYFKIKALDFRGNKSEFSEPVRVELPDRFPPVKPVFKKRRVLQEEIYLSWANSSSEDVISNTLQRKALQSPTDEWQNLMIINEIDIISEHLDSLVSFKKKYQYRIVAKDDDGLISISDTLVLQAIDGRIRGGIQDFAIEVNEENKNPRLTWSYQFKEPSEKILVYRGKNDHSLVTYQKLDVQELQTNQYQSKQEFEFIDNNIEKGATYTYCIQMVHKDGAKSKPSKKVMVTGF